MFMYSRALHDLRVNDIRNDGLVFAGQVIIQQRQDVVARDGAVRPSNPACRLDMAISN